jgi:hypothetical protein
MNSMSQYQISSLLPARIQDPNANPHRQRPRFSGKICKKPFATKKGCKELYFPTKQKRRITRLIQTCVHKLAGKANNKPSSVLRVVLTTACSSPTPWSGNHLSRLYIAAQLKRPTRDRCGPQLHATRACRSPTRSCSGWGLPSQHVSMLLVRSYRTVAPLPVRHIRLHRRSTFLWH